MNKLWILALLPFSIAASDTHSLTEIESAAIFLRHVADSGLKKGSPQSCGLNSAEALALTQPLKALRDEGLKFAQGKLKREPKFLSAIAKCEKKCHCGLYSDLLDGLDGWSGEAAMSTAKAGKENKKSVAKCAKKEAVSICKSSLFRELRATR